MKISNCCGQKVRLNTSVINEGTTVYNVCSKCEKPCTPVEPKIYNNPTYIKEFKDGSSRKKSTH